MIGILVAFLLALAPGWAQAAPVSAMAMVGQPALPPDFTALPYVDPNAKKGGVLREAAIGGFDSLNPWILSGSAPARIGLIYDRLMERSWDEPFSIYASLAESIDWDQPGHQLTIRLRDGARWHDGAAITADDVLFTVNLMRDTARPNSRRVYKLVTAGRVVDAQTLILDLDPVMDRESLMILAMMPVLPRHYWQGRDFNKASLDIPLGSGPYRIDNLKPGRSISYKRVENYWARDLPINRGLYNFDTLTTEYFRDDMVALEAFKAGTIDWRQEMDATNWAERYDFPARQQGRVVTETIPHHRPAWFRGFIFNTRRPPFDDVRVRRALTEAFDFGWVQQALFRGLYQRIDSSFANSALAARGEPNAAQRALLVPFADQISPDILGPIWRPDQFASPRHRQQEVDRLLTQAGWILRDGVRQNEKTGVPLRFELLINGPADEKMALEYGRMLKRLGIILDIRPVDAAQFRQRLDHFDYDMVSWRWINSLSPGVEQGYYWGSAAAGRTGGRNYAGVQSAAIDAVAATIPLATTPDQMADRTAALDRLVMGGFYMVPLYYAPGDWVAYWADRVRRPQMISLYGMVVEALMAKE